VGFGDPYHRQAQQLADARVAVARNNLPAAESLYRALLARDSTDSETSFLLGLVYLRMDSLAPAYKWLTRAVTLEPGFDAARNTLKGMESRARAPSPLP
jgi:Flp pilus assembly protein TadD